MFVLFILATIILIGAAIAAVAVAPGRDRRIAYGVIVGCFVLILISSFRVVGTKEIGVPTTFGKVGTKHYGAGPHLVAPWVRIHEMDGAIQTDDHLDNKCYHVRIANQQTGCAEVSMQWRINPKYVDFLYQNYRSFSHLRTQLVDRKLFSSVNDSLASFNPLNTVAAQAKKNPLPIYQNAIYREMKSKINSIDGEPLVEVLNVQLPIIHFDNETQSRINQLQQQVALTRIAEQEKLTNGKRSEANAALAKKSLTQTILISRCMDSLESLVKTKQPIPAGFSCWPGGSLAGVIAK